MKGQIEQSDRSSENTAADIPGRLTASGEIDLRILNGGRRPGAGRPPRRAEAKESRTMALSPILWQFIDHSGAMEGDNRSEKFELTVRRMRSFKDWYRSVKEMIVVVEAKQNQAESC